VAELLVFGVVDDAGELSLGDLDQLRGVADNE
jgi:hypothetical protein